MNRLKETFFATLLTFVNILFTITQTITNFLLLQSTALDLCICVGLCNKRRSSDQSCKEMAFVAIGISTGDVSQCCG